MGRNSSDVRKREKQMQETNREGGRTYTGSLQIGNQTYGTDCIWVSRAGSPTCCFVGTIYGCEKDVTTHRKTRITTPSCA